MPVRPGRTEIIMKAQVGQVWTVDIKPGGTEYPRTVKITSLEETHAITQNVNTNRRSRIRLAADGGLAGYKLMEVPAPAKAP
jgi:hypothetical protein